MKKRFLLTLLLLLIFSMASVASVASSATNDLENGNGTWTWYNGLPADNSQPGLGNDTRIIQFRIPESDWQGTSVGAPVWSITNNSANGPYDFDYNVETWNGGRGIQLVPKWDCGQETVTGTYTYTIKASYNGSDYESGATIIFVKDTYPTGVTMTVNEVDLNTNTVGSAVTVSDGSYVLQEGKDYVFTTDYIGNYPAVSADRLYMNGNLYGVLEEHGRYNSEFQSPNGGSIWSNNQMVFTAKKAGQFSFTPTLSIGMSNLMAQNTFSLAILDTNGNLPALSPNLVNWNWVDYSADIIDYPIYDSIPFGYGGATSNNHIWQESGFANIYIENWQDLQSEYGGNASWNVIASPNDLDYGMQTGDDGNHIWCYLNFVPTKDYVVTVTCTWGGQSTSKIFNLKASALTSAPTGLDNLPDEIETQVGQTITLEPMILPAGFTLSNSNQNHFIAQGLSSFAQRDWSQSVPTFTVNTAGTYTDEVGLSFGPLYVTKTVTFKVKDANGSVPNPKLDTEYREDTWYIGLPESFSDNGGAYCENAFAQMWSPQSVRDYSDTNITWNLTHVSGPDNFVLFYEPNSPQFGQDWMDRFFCAYVKPKSGVLTAGTSEYKMTATYKGVTYEGDMVIHTVDTSYPTSATVRAFETDENGSFIGAEMTITNGTLTVMTGGSYYLNGLFDNSTISVEDQWINSWYDNGGDRKERWNRIATDSTIQRSNTEYFTATNPGIYHVGANISQANSNLVVYVPITLAVMDEKGNIPKPVPEVSGYFSFTEGVELDKTGEFFVASGLPIDASDDGILYSAAKIFTYGVDNMYEIQNTISGNPTFNVTLKSGNVSWGSGLWGDESHIDVYLTSMPAVGSAQFEVTCTIDGVDFSQTVNVEFVSLPSRPVGVETSYSDPLIFKVGDHMDFDAPVWFTNNWSIGKVAYGLYGDGDFWDAINWSNETWSESGTYSMQLVACSDNICMNKTITVVVTESDGTMKVSDYKPFGTVTVLPADLMTVESQAFAGTQLTEVDIPAGVSIDPDAFDGTGLVAVYTHNDQNTIDWAVGNGIIALTE